MSAKTMGQVWDLDIPHNQLIVLLAMTDHADHSGGNMYPSMGLIAHKTGYSERQVKRIIKSLVEVGILILEKIGNGTTNTYRADFSNTAKKKPYKSSDKVSPLADDTHDTAMSPHLGHPDVTPTHDIQMSPKPSVEPSVNHTDDSKVVTMPQADGKKENKANPWYDAVKEVFGHTGSLNTEYSKFLRGVATNKRYKPYNLETPLDNPEQLIAWGKWYRKTVLGGNQSLNMVQSPEKIQSSIASWQWTIAKQLEQSIKPVMDDTEQFQAYLLTMLRDAS